MYPHAGGENQGVLLEGFILAGDTICNPIARWHQLGGRSQRAGWEWDFELCRLFAKGFVGDGLRLVGI